MKINSVYKLDNFTILPIAPPSPAPTGIGPAPRSATANWFYIWSINKVQQTPKIKRLLLRADGRRGQGTPQRKCLMNMKIQRRGVWMCRVHVVAGIFPACNWFIHQIADLVCTSPFQQHIFIALFNSPPRGFHDANKGSFEHVARHSSGRGGQLARAGAVSDSNGNISTAIARQLKYQARGGGRERVAAQDDASALRPSGGPRLIISGSDYDSRPLGLLPGRPQRRRRGRVHAWHARCHSANTRLYVV